MDRIINQQYRTRLCLPLQVRRDSIGNQDHTRGTRCRFSHRMNRELPFAAASSA